MPYIIEKIASNSPKIVRNTLGDKNGEFFGSLGLAQGMSED